MPRTRPPYSPEFRRQMVDLVRAGRDPADLAREFEPTAQSISHWVAQADRQEGRREEKVPVWWRLSVTSWLGCDVRTSSCVWSATSSLERVPGSHARPARSRPGLRIHERASGFLSGRCDGARARGRPARAGRGRRSPQCRSLAFTLGDADSLRRIRWSMRRC